jgi:cytoskeletal protein CcmA (bactofilin family)
MFKQGKDEEFTSPIASSSSPVNARQIPTIVSADAKIVGTISGVGDIQIDGTVEGDVIAERLVVGENAKINGELVAEHLEIRGHVTGSIRATNVKLAASAHFSGDVLHTVLSVESGAHFDGKCKYSDNPKADYTSSSAGQEKLSATAKTAATNETPDIKPEETVKTGAASKDTTGVAEKFAENRAKKTA